MVEYLTAHQSLEVLVHEKPVRYARGGSAQIVRGVISTAVGATLAAGTLYAIAGQHEVLKGATDSIGQFVDNLIPGDISYVNQARGEADGFLDNSGWLNRAWTLGIVGAATFGVYWLIKKGIRQTGDGVTSLMDSGYEHFNDGKTWKRHGGYTDRPSGATQKYGKPLTPVDSKEDLEHLAEGEIVLINGAVLARAEFYRTTKNEKTGKKTTRSIPAEEYLPSWSGTNHGKFTFELPQGVRIEGFSEGGLYDIARLIRATPDGKPIVRVEGKLGKNKAIQLGYMLPAYTTDNILPR